MDGFVESLKILLTLAGTFKVCKRSNRNKLERFHFANFKIDFSFAYTLLFFVCNELFSKIEIGFNKDFEWIDDVFKMIYIKSMKDY